MWPFTSYPEHTAGDVADRTFDYIIVGGGTAGSLIANRLSASSNVSVLVLEKGRVNAGLTSRIPLIGRLQTGVVHRDAEPNANMRGRRVRLLAGEMLGGTSRINSVLWNHGGRAQFDGWSRNLGLDNWSWEKVAPAFTRVEEDIQLREVEALGCMPYVDATMKRVGLSSGYSHCRISVDAKGRRSSALTAFLAASVVNERKDRLTICTGVVATKLNFSDGGARVTGVHIRLVGGDTEVLVRARREVIVCTGIINTPQLLMQSGIGPKDHLSAHGIPVIHDLPAVGKHLSTHALVPVMTELQRKDTLHIMETIAILWHLLLWLYVGTGVFASGGPQAAASFWSTTLDENTMTLKSNEADRNKLPDMEINIVPISTLFEHGIPGVPCMTWNVGLLQPFTTGSVELTSGTNPEIQPRLSLPLLADERDIVRLRQAVRFAMRLADEFASPEIGYPQPAPLAIAPGIDLEYLDAVLDKNKSKGDKKKLARALPPQKDAWNIVTDDEIDEYVKRTVIGSYDPSGTCRISLSSKDGVIDQRLKVHGVQNLRIADASVIPQPGNSSLSAPIYMIAQRCADFVGEDYGLA